MDIFNTLFYFIIAIGVLVSFHEFGHFWVARKLGVKVLKFSVGFGKVLWSYQKKPDSTEYVISAIPLGGFVKMVDEREDTVDPEDLPYAFNRQPVWARTAIVAAGPIFNLVLAVALFWSVLVIGETGIKPIIGTIKANTLAAQAGFAEGDEILSVNDRATPTWTEAMTVLVTSALDGEHEFKIAVQDRNQQQSVKNLSLSDEDSKTPDGLYERLGFQPWSPKLQPIIGNILPDSAALAANLKTGDLIISADGNAITEWIQWVDYVKSHPSKPISLLVQREGQSLPITIIPKSVTVGDKTEGKIGAGVKVPEDLLKAVTVEYSLSPLAAIPEACKTTYFYASTTLAMMGKMLIGKASVENLSGPISIAQYAGQSAHMGLTPFLKFMALVSVSLGVLNLLPVPVLDGGHLMFYTIEAIKGSPLSDNVQLFYQKIGMALLMTLMALAMFMDINRLFQ
ncbi:sigma E protease regulator RseP [Methylosoma difficile]